MLHDDRLKVIKNYITLRSTNQNASLPTFFTEDGQLVDTAGKIFKRSDGSLKNYYLAVPSRELNVSEITAKGDNYSLDLTGLLGAVNIHVVFSFDDGTHFKQIALTNNGWF